MQDKPRYPEAKPQRTAGLISQQAGAETLVYDERRHQAFCLNPLAAAVWTRCDGLATPAQIGEEASLELGCPVGEEAVLLALERLRVDGLLQVDGLLWPDSFGQPDGSQGVDVLSEQAHSLHETFDFSRPDGLQEPDAMAGVVSRRSVVSRLGTGALLLLPAIAMVAAPTAAQAYNGCFDCVSPSAQSRAAARQRAAASAQTATPATDQ